MRQISHKNRVDFQNFFVDIHFAAVYCIYCHVYIKRISEKMLEELKNLQVLDYIRSGALAIGLLAALFHSKFVYRLAPKKCADFELPEGVQLNLRECS